jgi:formylglycine-generating enzyme required for sulfatase activity
VHVCWLDAKAFCDWLSKKEGKAYRLPTEAEWEYACRAGSTGDFCFGDDEARLGEYAWYKANSDDTTHPVGQKKPNAWGLYDMHGNVVEWCQDWYDYAYYASSPAEDPKGPSDEEILHGGDDDAGEMTVDDMFVREFAEDRVQRGGCWYWSARSARSAARGRMPISNPAFAYEGFRVACSVDAASK